MYITHLTEQHLPNCEDYYIEHDNPFHLKRNSMALYYLLRSFHERDISEFDLS